MTTNVVALPTPDENQGQRDSIYNVFYSFDDTNRFRVKTNEGATYSVIEIVHKHKHVPNFKLVWFPHDGGLYRVYIRPYHVDELGGSKFEISHSISTLRNVHDAYQFANMLIFLDTHRPRNLSD